MRSLRAPRIAFVGTGANGAGIGADVAEAGLDVTFIDQWPANVEAIRRDGVRVDMGGASRTVQVPVLHLCDVATIRTPFDVVFLGVKAYDTDWATRLIVPLLHSEGVVVGLQNGMTGEAISQAVGPERTLPAVIEVTAAMYEPGVVERHSGHDRSWFAIGPPPGGHTKHIDEVALMLSHAGTVEVTDDIASAKWMKLVLNAGELLPSAILDLSIVECARVPGMRDLMVRTGNEALHAAQLLGMSVRPIFGMEGDAAGDPATFMETILDELVSEYVLTHSRSTMLQDWIKGRRAEVRDINGLVVNVLESSATNAPLNRMLLRMGLEIESGQRRRGMHNLPELLSEGLVG